MGTVWLASRRGYGTHSLCVHAFADGCLVVDDVELSPRMAKRLISAWTAQTSEEREQDFGFETLAGRTVAAIFDVG
jgi:hypothetical protein